MCDVEGCWEAVLFAMLSLIKSEKIKMNYNALLEEIDLAENLNELYPEKEFYDATE